MAMIARRFGFGSRNLRGHSGLEPANRDDVAAETLPAPHGTSRDLDGSEVLDDFLGNRQKRREARALIAARAESGQPAPSMAEALREIGHSPRALQSIHETQVANRFQQALTTPDAFFERLVWFWSNHFAVSMLAGGPLRVLGGPYEQEVIRQHVTGNFADMLLAAVQHTAMLRYLDGRSSVGPRSRVGLSRDRGLNENLAREILELHTLGVDGGYDQEDVRSLARMLTGWRCRALASDHPGEFVFSRTWHEPGAKVLLGKTYPDDGYEQGVAALRDLAYHPSTANHLAVKLVRHFVADQPSQRLVGKLRGVFLETEGHLAAVSQALIDSPEAREAPPAKLRLPQEFIVAMLRATNVEFEPRELAGMCSVMGHPVWAPPGPDGFPDTVAHWLSPEGMKRRLDVAMAVAERVEPALEPMEVLEGVIGDIATDDTRWAVARAESRQQAFALLFMSPEFQWR